jgi:hypothetical protein
MRLWIGAQTSGCIIEQPPKSPKNALSLKTNPLLTACLQGLYVRAARRELLKATAEWPGW